MARSKPAKWMRLGTYVGRAQIDDADGSVVLLFKDKMRPGYDCLVTTGVHVSYDVNTGSVRVWYRGDSPLDHIVDF